jgi:hypothetical protein
MTRVTFNQETGESRVEHLATTDGSVTGTSNPRTDADVDLPSSETVLAELNHFDKQLTDIRDRLNAKEYGRDGKERGYRISNDQQRASLERQLALIEQTKAAAVQRLAQLHNLAEQKVALKAKAAERGEVEAGTTQAQVQRAQQIAALVDETGMSRTEATKLIDAERNRAAAERIVRSGR